MQHQNWETYIIHTNNNNKNKNEVKDGNRKKQYVPDKSKKMDEKIEKGEMKHRKIDIELSRTIQKARLSRNLTQKQLAKQLSLPDKLINEIETGKAIYNGQQIMKIKRFLKI